MDNRSSAPKLHSKTQPTQSFPVVLLVLLLSLGLLFRVANLDHKIFWVDEVATAIRASGYTKAEVITQLADGSLHTPADLLAYQQLNPSRPFSDTLNALIRSPEHAPLYFVLIRVWMQAFGSSVSAIRSFSVLCSLLVLPWVYWLCRQLFRSKLESTSAQIGRTAVALMAVSPFFVAYAQEARPYSFWLLTLVLCGGSLLRAMHRNSRLSWLIYTLTLIVSLYTSLLSLFLTIGQAVYVITLEKRSQIIRRFGWALGAAALTFLPWIWVILHQREALATNTTWMRTPIHPLAMIAIWLYSFAVLFFDVPVVAQLGWIAVMQFLIAAMVLTIMAVALYRLSRLPRRIWLFIAVLCIPIPLVLIGLDLIFQGQASASPRYLIPSQFGVLVAVAYCCSGTAAQTRAKHLWQAVTVFLLSLSLMSCLINLNRSPDYQKARNRHNPEIAAFLNQAPNPVLIAEPGQTIDLLSLSHSLNATVQIQILSIEQIVTILQSCRNNFLFNPSPQLINRLNQTKTLNFKQIYQPELITSDDIYLSLGKTNFATCDAP
jgi:uncharacterized membrane protein